MLSKVRLSIYTVRAIVLLSSTQSCSDGTIDCTRYIDELYGPHLGSETPRGLKQLVHVLDQILPGIGVKKRFYLDSLTHQKIVDVLGNNGQSTIIRRV